MKSAAHLVSSNADSVQKTSTHLPRCAEERQTQMITASGLVIICTSHLPPPKNPWKSITWSVFTLGNQNPGFLLWMDEILHHFESMGSHCALAFGGESSVQAFLGGAKWISQPSTISPCVPSEDSFIETSYRKFYRKLAKFPPKSGVFMGL